MATTILIIAIYQYKLYYTPQEVSKFNNLEAPIPFPIPYKLGRHAGNLPAHEFLVEPELGGNCERSAYFIAQILGYEPPPDGMRPAEFFADSEVGVPVRLEDAKTGDIIGFRRPDRTDSWGLHVGIIWARKNSPTYVVHNARHIRHLTLQTLGETMQYPHHSTIGGLRRLKPNPMNFNPDRLIRYNLTFLLEGAA